jgi:hypothetical protein
MGDGCAHGPPLPPGVYCVDCRFPPTIVTELATPQELFAGRADPYLGARDCAPPTAATVVIPGADEAPHVRRRRRG